MKILTHLSEKYMIESLQVDVRVSFLLYCTHEQNYAQRLAMRKDFPMHETWHFAARYSLFELEEYCQSNEAVFEIINDTLRSDSDGLESPLQREYPLR